MMPFVDYDRDGYRDFLRVIMVGPVGYATLQITSGFDGSTLWTRDDGYYHDPVACYAGDMDGDGEPEIAVLYSFSSAGRRIDILSVKSNRVLWQVTGSSSGQFGAVMLGDLDVTGDGRPDFVTITKHTSMSDIFVYDTDGALRYIVPCLSQGLIAISLCKMGDMNSDGCDDFLVGCNDTSGRGVQMLLSGQSGALIRQGFGLLPGDKTSEHVSNLGDIDGDGVNDWAAFAYWSASREIAVAYSGQTGAVIRSWVDYANSVVTGEDFDQDGVGDIVTGADWYLSLNVRGRTICTSGRDGTELWHLDNFQSTTGHNGTSGWMETSASLGVQPGSPYPVVAWMDINWWTTGTYHGRIRAYDMARAGQGPVTGVACSSSGQPPLIGARQTTTGARVTIAKAPPGAVAFLNLALANQTSYGGLPLPINLTPFGLTGCELHVGPLASEWRILGTTGIDRGYAAVDFPFQLVPTLGTSIVAQWLVFDPATLAYAATAKHELRGQ
ncbi:MAG TPA: hypothetical protein VFD82_01395 [Planctomycetota bacterium]|nr:hypothetical protein [Planctomycetota bacterium]